MKKCLCCGNEYSSANFDCIRCGYSPVLLEGFYSFGYGSAKAGEGFDVEGFAKLFELEQGSFWFQARNQIILWAIATFFPGANKFVEIGCGTGFVLDAIRGGFPEMKLLGSELFLEGLAFARKRLGSDLNVELIQMDARRFPYVNEFDLVGAFDVLEHIEDDTLVLKGIYEALKPGGGLLITVPQHQWLWSSIDSAARHCRRYSRLELKSKLMAAGFDCVCLTSFVSLLLPLMLFSRLKKKKSGTVEDVELSLPAAINSFFRLIMRLEFAAIRAGLRFPVGGSLLAIARKKC